MHPDKQAELAQNVIALESKYSNIIEALQREAPGLLVALSVQADVRFLHALATYQAIFRSFGKGSRTAINEVKNILQELAAREAAAD